MHSSISFSAIALTLVRAALSLECKCRPTDPCWPSSSEWDTFNTTISGRLIRAVPPGSICYPSEPNYDEDACQKVLSKWGSSAFHSDDPVSVGATVWANNSCNPIYPNGTSFLGDPEAGSKGCSMGAYPYYVVNASEASDVQAALYFAAKGSMRLNIKNTGHNGARTTAHGSLSIWTHNLKSFQFHQSYQIRCPRNAPERKKQRGATIGAGLQSGELLDALSKHDSVAVSGTNLDVGFLGWAMGGGHGFLTGAYGMGADNIIEAEVITPDGELVIANSCQNEDLFWAIRGGGGGTFGLVLSATIKAYPMPSLTFWGLGINAKNGTSPKKWWDLIAEVHALVPDLQDHGIHGYYSLTGPPDSSTVQLGGSFFFINGSNETMAEAMRPLQALLAAAEATASSSVQSIQVKTYSDLLEMLPSVEGGAKSTSVSASRLVSRRTVINNTSLLAHVMEEVGPKFSIPTDGTPNPSLSGTMTISRKPVDNSLNPAWRDTAVHLISAQKWTDTLAKSSIQNTVLDMTYRRLNLLRQLDPSSGAYVNEANSFEPGWQWSFYGPQYERLLKIKRKYDAKGLLWCRQCVGSEDWVEQENGSLCRQFQPFF